MHIEPHICPIEPDVRLRSTIEFWGLWEQMNDPNFKGVEFDPFKNDAGSNAFVMSPQKWVKETDAIKENLISPELPKYQQGFVYADEAAVLNVALFGKTNCSCRRFKA